MVWYSFCQMEPRKAFVDMVVTGNIWIVTILLVKFFGVINAFDWAISNGYEKLKIYHDYEGLSKWITNEWCAKAK